MKIDINGKRNISLDFNAPRKFRLVKDGAEIPYIRTGKNSFRLTKDVDGSVELEEVIEKPRYMKPFNLQAPQMAFISSEDVGRLNEAVQQMSLVNPEDVMAINNAAQKIDSVQMYIAEKQQQIEATQNYIDQQQQILNDSALNLQALETNNNQRLDSAETSIYSLASDLDIVKNATLENTYALDSIREQELITQASLETKADKTDVEKIKEELEEYKDDNESFKNALSNYSGGLASDSPVPEGGKDGQILTKITDESGVYGWKDKTPVIVKSKTIPTASEKYKGEVYQYVGETGDYTHGYIYECRQNGTSYSWVRLDVQPNHSAEIASLTTRVGNLETGKQDKLSQTQMDAVNSGANQSNIAQITTNQTNINIINGKIPSDASSSNQLADKAWVGNQGYITEITSVDVTTALGYTPYDASNPAGYTSNVGTVTSVNNTSPDGTGNVTLTLPDPLPSQTGQSGKYLTTDGTDASWANVDALPSQTGQSGKYLTTDGSSASWAALSVNPDNKSINKNASDQLQTIGVINQNDTTTAIKTWTGTKAQYDAIVTKDANTLYNITDDTDVTLSLLETIYPVGSIYITTADTCPLSTLISGSTWALVSSGRVLQGADGNHSAGTMIEAGLPNITGYMSNWASNVNSGTSTSALYGTVDNAGARRDSTATATGCSGINFNASRSNAIYGNSSTVQPPAYCVNIFRRTA